MTGTSRHSLMTLIVIVVIAAIVGVAYYLSESGGSSVPATAQQPAMEQPATASSTHTDVTKTLSAMSASGATSTAQHDAVKAVLEGSSSAAPSGSQPNPEVQRLLLQSSHQ